MELFSHGASRSKLVSKQLALRSLCAMQQVQFEVKSSWKMARSLQAAVFKFGLKSWVTEKQISDRTTWMRADVSLWRGCQPEVMRSTPVQVFGESERCQALSRLSMSPKELSRTSF